MKDKIKLSFYNLEEDLKNRLRNNVIEKFFRQKSIHVEFNLDQIESVNHLKDAFQEQAEKYLEILLKNLENKEFWIEI